MLRHVCRKMHHGILFDRRLLEVYISTSTYNPGQSSIAYRSSPLIKVGKCRVFFRKKLPDCQVGGGKNLFRVLTVLSGIVVSQTH